MNVKLLCKVAIFLAVLPFLITAGNEAFALQIAVDGDLGDWGVTPFTQWNPSSSTASKTIENNYGRAYSSWNQFYDLKAIYFDSDQENLYFAIVSRNAYIGTWAHESMGIDLSGKTYDQLMKGGESQSNIYCRTGYYQYGAQITDATVDTPLKKDLYRVRKWYGEYWNGSASEGLWFPYSVGSGDILGTYDLYNKRYYDSLGAWYVLEGAIPTSYFQELTPGAPVELFMDRVTCVRDWITVRGAYNPVPEPASFILVVSGLLVSALLKRKK